MRFSVLALFFSVLLFTFVVDAKPRHGAGRRRLVAEKREQVYKGHGTWFIPSIHGGSIGACQKFEGDSDYIVAMNAKQYGQLTGVSGWCFKKIRIFSGDKSVVATVTDACPECKYGDLDMTPAVFKKLGHLDQGIVSIKWKEWGN